jgi:hypothetical protein
MKTIVRTCLPSLVVFERARPLPGAPTKNAATDSDHINSNRMFV